MIGFENFTSIWAIGIWALTALGVAVFTYLAQKRLMRPSYLRLLIVARVCALAMVALFLLQPFREIKTPDSSSFTVAVLGDCSGSMRTRDCDKDLRRIEELKKLGVLGELPILAEGTETRLRRTKHVFSDRLYSSEDGNVEILSGKTAIGTALHEIMSQKDSLKTGAVLICSDGNSNDGLPVMEAARKFAAAGIPVSCIGIGSFVGEEDFRISAPAKPLKIRKGEEAMLPLKITNSFKKEMSAEISIRENGISAEKKTVRVPASSEQSVEFKVKPQNSGIHLYSFLAEGVAEDKKPETDLDFAFVEVKDPDKFRVLWLGDFLNCEHKFLKMSLLKNEQISMEAVIRNGAKKFYRSPGLREKLSETDGFPEKKELLNELDAIVIDTRVVSELSETARTGILNFVGNRGGGILFFGPSESLDAEFLKLLPARKSETSFSVNREYLESESNFVFPENSSESLFSSPGPYIPDGVELQAVNELKQGARSIFRTRKTGKTVLCAQIYGAGRTAWLGMESSWRWRLSSDADLERHKYFWNGLILWLSSANKPRISSEMNGKKFNIDEEMPMTVKVLGGDYLPSEDAVVKAIIKDPSGDVSEIVLSSSKTRGQFGEAYIPAKPGGYSVSVSSSFPDGETIVADFQFIALYGSSEMNDTSYREDLLRDISRLTGGVFMRRPDLEAGRLEIPVSQNVEFIKTRKKLTDKWLFALLLFAFFAAEWHLRRRIGLK